MKTIQRKLLAIFFLLVIQSSVLFSYHWDLSAVMIFQDEAPYLKEWIEYYRLIGVQHFFLYSNNSTDNYKKVLAPYIKSGVVELFEWNYSYDYRNNSQWDKIQCNAYRDAHRRCRSKTKWLAVLDSDEFFVPVKDKDLRSLLKKFENNPKLVAVSAKWVMFGTSDVEKIPDDKLMIELLLMNSGAPNPTTLFKTISRPDRVVDYVNPHFVTGMKDGFTVALGPDVLQLNHYWCRDEYFLYNVKIPRREKIGTPRDVTLTWAAAANGSTNEFSMPIIRFVKELRKRMGFKE